MSASSRSAPPPRTLYVYYRVPVAQRETAQAAIESMQTELRQAEPGLSTSLLCRTGGDDVGNGLTWMEVYAHPQGVSAALEARLSQLSSHVPAGLIGPRHVEVFCPMAPSTAGSA